MPETCPPPKVIVMEGHSEAERALPRGGAATRRGGLEFPRVDLRESSRRAWITATHIYGFLSCEHAVWLEFYGNADEKLGAGPALTQLLRRGRELEDRLVAPLGWDEPTYAKGAFAEGAAATRAMLASGVPGLRQAVLYEHPWLGIPDLLRRVPGSSAFGDFHYVVGDVKSSRKPRADQALQVAFYSRLLARLQDRRPDHGFLILRDGNEERIDLDAIDIVLDEVLEELVELLSRGPESERRSTPHHTTMCRDCGWRPSCSAKLDVHWVPGLTRSVREVLAERGFDSLEALSLVEPRKYAKAGVLPEASWQRAKQGAHALRSGAPVFVRKPRGVEFQQACLPVVVLHDGFEARVPLVAWLFDDSVRFAEAPTREDEPAMWHEAMAAWGKSHGALVHSGGVAARLYEARSESSHPAEVIDALERRCTDLMSIVRGTWIFPEPVVLASEALAFLEGARPASEVDSVPLLLEVGDREGLRSFARRELKALESLLRKIEEVA
ncbi:MAG: TM0106 family RecB-like putative nuclease [Planctomycetes bacterium]|nr:TM0106 family RecB-like putative nuclease [Planctomycetota bacterium]